jgi:thiosulfate reductase cytochrome b subunit
MTDQRLFVQSLNPVRHTFLIRATHWVHTLAFCALVVSGAAILLAHPRLYWGEVGGFGSPALIELPLPLNLEQSGWGRSLHFLSAWISVLTGTIYVCSGFVSGHFKRNLIPARTDVSRRFIVERISNVLRWRKPQDDPLSYNGLQRSAYLVVVFLLFPLMIATGLAMSPAVTAAFPVFVEVFGGYQSSRTIHFVVSNVLVLFLLVHVAMVFLSGFRGRMRSMITGRAAAAETMLEER